MIDANSVRARREELRGKLLACKRPDHLFSSNFTEDEQPSITVSSLALQVLSELREPAADLVYRAIVNASYDQSSRGPWPAQGGGPPHTIAASWAIFSASRARLDAVHDMSRAVAWLLEVQGRNGGWPHSKGGTPRPFHTALALSALLEYLEKLVYDSPADETVTPERIRRAIDLGIDYLTKNALSKVRGAGWLWDQRARGPGICIASSSLCLHVALKASRLENLEYLSEPACQSLALIAGSLSDGILRELTFKITGLPDRIYLWPQISENEPAYWYSYFTPLLALTFSDALYQDPRNANIYRNAIEECVRWIVSDYEPDGNNQSAKGVWALVNAMLVLHRASPIVAPTVARGSRVVTALRRMGPHLTADNMDFVVICKDVDENLMARITTPASQESMWGDLISLVEGDAAKLLRLMSVIMERYPNSDISSEISMWISKE